MCGILAVIANKNVNSYYFLKQLEQIQHRGQDSCGIAFVNKEQPKLIGAQKINGMVNKLQEHDKFVNSNIFIGHTRYTTSGHRSKKRNMFQSSQYGIHPIISIFRQDTYTFVFNGNIPFISDQFNYDTDYIKHFIESRKHLSFKEVLLQFVKSVPRAFNIIFIYQGVVYAIRDRYGTRPFKFLKSRDDSSIYLCSEDYFLDDSCWINVDVPEGSLTIIDTDLDIVTESILETKPFKETAHCVFEHIYFMKEKSMSDGFLVKDSRVKMGHLLACNKEDQILHGDNNYIVSSVPDTATTSAVVYAKTLELNYSQFIKKNSRINRTFIITDSGERSNYSKEKYIIDGDQVKDKDIILVDDSIVRGTTLKTLVSLLKEYKPKSVHIRITSPPITNTCNLGIDIPTKEELIYNSFNNTDKLRDYLGVDSLKYLEISDLKSIFQNKGMCMGCIDGDYNKNKNLEW